MHLITDYVFQNGSIRREVKILVADKRFILGTELKDGIKVAEVKSKWCSIFQISK